MKIAEKLKRLSQIVCRPCTKTSYEDCRSCEVKRLIDELLKEIR